MPESEDKKKQLEVMKQIFAVYTSENPETFEHLINNDVEFLTEALALFP